MRLLRTLRSSWVGERPEKLGEISTTAEISAEDLPRKSLDEEVAARTSGLLEREAVKSATGSLKENFFFFFFFFFFFMIATVCIIIIETCLVGCTRLIVC